MSRNAKDCASPVTDPEPLPEREIIPWPSADCRIGRFRIAGRPSMPAPIGAGAAATGLLRINYYRTALHELRMPPAISRLDRNSPIPSAARTMPARNWLRYLDSLRRPQHCSKVGDGRPR
jgi:hypothetical protein